MARTASSGSAPTFQAALAAGRLVVAGCFDALSARLAEEVGYAAVYISGFAVEASLLASPDLGLITRTEMAAHAQRIARTVDIPVVCDVDTGYGDALDVARTVREFAHAGVAAIQLEDQTEPKRCPLVETREVLSREEAVRRVDAAVSARPNSDFAIIARTDADETSFDEATARARAYLDHGADAVMSPLSGKVDRLPLRQHDPDVQMAWHRRFCIEVDGPTIALSIPPTCTAEDMLDAGYRAVILPTLSFRAAATAMMRALEEARIDGRADAYFDREPSDERVVGLGLLRLLGLDEALRLRRGPTPLFPS